MLHCALLLSVSTLCFYLSSFFVVASLAADVPNRIGINYGRVGDNLPSPYQSIEHILSLRAGRVKLYDTNPEVLQLLAGTNLQVSVMVANSDISGIAASKAAAANWVGENIVPFHPATMIRFLCVGNEVLSDQNKAVWLDLVPAMRRLKAALKVHNITNIKISSPVAMDVLAATFPPSNASFRDDISRSVMVPMLHFLNRTKSFLFLDVFPYFTWKADPAGISLDTALFRGNQTYTDPGSRLNYANLLDQMLDAVVFATEKLGFPDINLLISETGWPTGGDITDAGASIRNAATYNRNVVKRMTARPAIGTPSRPGVTIPTFLFALYNNEKQRRHWGLLEPSGEPVYEIDLTGNRALSDYPALPNNRPYMGEAWCVPVQGANETALTTQIGIACTQSNTTCQALQPGRECYQPVRVTWHASYAFSSYWAQFHTQGASCYFDGLAQLTTINPSIGSCQFPSVTV